MDSVAAHDLRAYIRELIHPLQPHAKLAILFSRLGRKKALSFPLLLKFPLLKVHKLDNFLC
jgi:hypothetical protein